MFELEGRELEVSGCIINVGVVRLVGLMWPAGPACMSSCQLGRDVVRRIAINLVR